MKYLAWRVVVKLTFSGRLVNPIWEGLEISVDGRGIYVAPLYINANDRMTKSDLLHNSALYYSTNVLRATVSIDVTFVFKKYQNQLIVSFLLGKSENQISVCWVGSIKWCLVQFQQTSKQWVSPSAKLPENIKVGRDYLRKITHFVASWSYLAKLTQFCRKFL